jgi:hypothetical protein
MIIPTGLSQLPLLSTGWVVNTIASMEHVNFVLVHLVDRVNIIHTLPWKVRYGVLIVRYSLHNAKGFNIVWKRLVAYTRTPEGIVWGSKPSDTKINECEIGKSST